MHYFRDRHYDEALAQLRKAEEVNPNCCGYTSSLIRGFAYREKGMYKEAFVEFQKVPPVWRLGHLPSCPRCRECRFDAAGLDFLTSRGKEWYVRLKRQRTLKPGDRIAVDRGIAVVEHADAHQVHALWKGGKLRLLCEDIAWDDVNSRWELNGSA